MILCPECNRVMPSESSVCGRCGAPLLPDPFVALGLKKQKKAPKFVPPELGLSFLIELLADQGAITVLDLDGVEIPEDVLELVPRDLAQAHQLIPLGRSGETLRIAMADPANVSAVEDVSYVSGCKIEVVIATEESIERAIQTHYLDD